MRPPHNEVGVFGFGGGVVLVKVRMFESLRTKIYGVLASESGNSFAPIRIVKNAALAANDVVGRPLATAEEFDERREFESDRNVTDAVLVTTEQAPVVVFHIERLPTELHKILDILKGEDIEHTVRAISDDEAAISAAKMDSDNARFPMVFIAGDFVGGAAAMTNMISSGELRRRVFGK